MKPIAMTPVESSQISEIGHDPESNTLAIRFKSGSDAPGSLYHYNNFSAEQFDSFSKSESKGRYFGANIKRASKEHPYTKINEKKEE